MTFARWLCMCPSTPVRVVLWTLYFPGSWVVMQISMLRDGVPLSRLFEYEHWEFCWGWYWSVIEGEWLEP